MRGVLRVAVIATVVLCALGMLAQENPAGTQTINIPEQTSLATPQAGHVWVPSSSLARPQDAGLRAHTNVVLFSLDGNKPAGLPSPKDYATAGADSTTMMAETPASLGCLYVNSPSYSGCKPNTASGTGGPSSSGYGAIVIVDAYDNPNAAADLQTFDTYWGLAAPLHFNKVLATNTSIGCGTPPANANWSVESSLDIEWAHVFSPNASIVLVEASDNSDTCLFYAEQVAFNYIVAHHPGGQVTNSWGGSELSDQSTYDPLFAGYHYSFTKQITAFASTGDDGCGVSFPSTDPWVVAVGGTSVLRDSATGGFSSEACWGGSGGGTSAVETYATTFSGGHMGPWANYQYPIFGQASRAVPDISFDADPSSGVWVYSGYGAGGWLVVGGTSLSSPAMAGIVNRAKNQLGGVYLYPIANNNGYFTTEENNLIYAQMPTHTTYGKNFYDVKTGSNGCSAGAVVAWDYCTGVGSPRGSLGR